MKKILITGSNGFIGSYLVEEALSRGYEVFAGIRSKSNREFLHGKKINFFEIDFSSRTGLENKLNVFRKEHGKFDYIIHNAGITKAKNKEDFQRVNFDYTQNFVDALIAAGCVPEKFIYISSLAAYGPKNDSSPITDSDTPKPITLYGESKLKTERFLHTLKDFPFLIIRPSAVYGPRDRAFLVVVKMIRRGIEPYLGNGNQLLSFIYVSDLSRVIFNALESQIVNRAYFISDGLIYSARSFNEYSRKHLRKRTMKIRIPAMLIDPLAFSVEKISALLGMVPTFNRERSKEFQAANWSCDTKALESDLGFTSEYNLEKGLHETINWYKKEGWL